MGMTLFRGPWQFRAMKTATHTLTLAMMTGGALIVPEWLQLVPAGAFTGVDGRGPYVNSDPEAVVALFAREGTRLPVDENHSTELASRRGEPSPARGWIVAMEVRDGAIWGKVEWTETGQAMMTERAYGFLSPVFLHTLSKPLTVMKLTSVALTNNPNLTQLPSLHTKQETEMLEQLRKLLGLPDTADEAAILAAATAMHTAQAAQAAMMTSLAAAAGAPGATGDALVTAVQTAVGKPGTADAATEIAELKGQIVAMHNQLAAYVGATAQEKAVAAIDKAIEDGKVFPAVRDIYIARHVKDPTEVEREIALLPSLHTGGIGNRQPPKTGEITAEPDAEEKQAMAMMGIDPVAYAKTRNELFGKAI